MTVDPFASSTDDDDKEAAAFLSGGSSSIAAKFPTEGFVVQGTVLDYRVTDQTDMDSGEPMFFYAKKLVKESDLTEAQLRRANPAKMMVIELQCEPTGITWETNQYIEKPVPDDDGLRSLYVRGNMREAIQQAIKDAGARGPERGAYLQIRRGKSVKRKGSQFASHTFTAKWTPAAQNPHAPQQTEAENFLSAKSDDGFAPVGPAAPAAPVAPVAPATQAASVSDPWGSIPAPVAVPAATAAAPAANDPWA